MLSKGLKVSVIIPVYNEENYLGDCLRALQNQTYKPFEIIVIDNNSSDNSAVIARSFTNVKVLRQTQPGILPTRSLGFDSASGDVIARTDADTRPDKNWLEKVVGSFERNRKIDALTGPIFYYDLPLPKLFKFLGIKIQNRLAGLKKSPHFLAGANMAIRSRVWQEVKSSTCRSGALHEDLDLAIHLKLSGYKIAYEKKMIVATSARRLNIETKSFFKYIKAYEHTYFSHEVKRIRIRLPILMFMPLHFLVRFTSQERSHPHFRSLDVPEDY